ncbi:MAG: aminotransferase class I/II-fold pyridoxal phosphate-dependent enzyme [Oscillospiraceae bacterium]|nr:aminotransferase class I/II-fold pyridoxal phosphate-dependent enzyme [Oscillospiraceae bacterium]
MSRFFSAERRGLTPYTPGEQPRGETLIKLNTNEAPYPPPQSVIDAAADAARATRLYSDPEGIDLRRALGEYHGISSKNISLKNISLGNGSDETLAFAFAAFGGQGSAFAFPDITYGFYPVFASLFNIPYTEIPTDAALAIRTEDYISIGKNIVLANPNAPTGIVLPLSDIESIAASNPDHVVIIDEAYADFWGETAIPLTARYENLLVVRTYSKSRFLAGARLGYAVGNAELIRDLETVRYSFNPYNINSMTLAAGAAALGESKYYKTRWDEIIAARGQTQAALTALGFDITPSQANFVFARRDGVSGETLQKMLRERGVLVRTLGRERIRDRLRITVGTPQQMKQLIDAMADALKNL